MAEPLERRTERAGVVLHYWEWYGGAPATLLLHGIGNYGRYWDFFADAVAGRLRLLAPDARGHGESDKPDTGYSADEFAADAMAVLDAAGVRRALLVGHSMGGRHATHAAAHHPDRVFGLVVVDTAPEGTGGERVRRLLFQRPERFPDHIAALAYLRETSPGYADAVYANRMRWVFDEDERGLAWRSAPHALRAIGAEATPAAERWATFRAVRCPALLVRGTRSPVLSPELARRAADAVGARLLELDAAHNVALERPRELADAVAAFAADIVAGAG